MVAGCAGTRRLGRGPDHAGRPSPGAAALRPKAPIRFDPPHPAASHSISRPLDRGDRRQVLHPSCPRDRPARTADRATASTRSVSHALRAAGQELSATLLGFFRSESTLYVSARGFARSSGAVVRPGRKGAEHDPQGHERSDGPRRHAGRHGPRRAGSDVQATGAFGLCRSQPLPPARCGVCRARLSPGVDCRRRPRPGPCRRLLRVG